MSLRLGSSGSRSRTSPSKAAPNCRAAARASPHPHRRIAANIASPGAAAWAPPIKRGVTRFLETSLYVEEFERACSFYEQVLGLNSIYRDQRLCAYDVGSRGVLLLFLRGRSFPVTRLKQT